jgi:hypothetical protein
MRRPNRMPRGGAGFGRRECALRRAVRVFCDDRTGCRAVARVSVAANARFGVR